MYLSHHPPPLKGLLDDAFAGAAQSYEALCRKHMDAFMRGLEVGQCVGGWVGGSVFSVGMVVWCGCVVWWCRCVIQGVC